MILAKEAFFFGPNQQFSGYSPYDIPTGVNGAYSFLIQDAGEPVVQVVRFYQLFVYVHPFYDANGRIGRFIMDVYLHYYGRHISWKKLNKNQKWLKKLNDCHRRVGQESYDRYSQILTNH